ncbi:ImpA family type VI secretion system protein [Bosea sp. (in: a-proteobacteria)]|uniref:type VI secretion system protein TssA n=1 Tax=Bosea sp. (in: a-proteobacteria) TaxID=1871050 RepID=UPI002733DDAE|nr:type VI secretion system ImpA family N-terminal domain-containing protein [Bosea sp. (in: a-proteobacteria)]MDP3410998.1 type VI secretion system ImpA family N-terminal domain-containing protein [Bosea sp. (in: a-proteobacteria)]
MALNFAEFAGAISDDDPSGPDLEDDADFMNVTARLEVALPAQYFRRDDDGRQIAFDRSQIEFPAAFSDLGKLLERSRDLRVLVLGGKLAILNRDVPGFAACLTTIASLLAQQWETVHPRALDGDYVMREVALQSLDELPTVVLPLQHAPLFVSRRIGPFAFRSQLVATGETRLVEGEQHPDQGMIQAALGDIDIDDLTASLARIRAIAEALAAIRAIWQEKMGADHALSFPRLSALVDQIVAFLDAAAVRRVPGHQAMPAAEPTPGAAAPAGSVSVVPGGCGDILQVKDTLAACLGYFRRMEPSSPAVLLIGQAQQLIGKSLIEVIQIMFPEHFGQAVIEIGDRTLFRLPLERLGAPEEQAEDDGYDDGEDAADPSDEASFDEDGGEADHGSGEASRQPAEDAGPAVPPARHVASRAEAVAGMRAVAAFYRQNEPSHPTPLLMDKACALAQQDFMALLSNILPDVAMMPEADS